MEKIIGVLPPILYVLFLLAERRWPARPLVAVRRWGWKGLLFFLLGGAVMSTLPGLWAGWVRAHRLVDLEVLGAGWGLAEAEADGDRGRAARAREELELLAEELARGVGLGGRGRKTGGSVERARINIQRRIADALTKIEEACRPLGRRLARNIRTGAYCQYDEA